MSDYLRGTVLMVVGVLMLSPDALLIYLVEADRWTILFWRGSLTAATLLTGMIVLYRKDAIRRFAEIGRGGILIGFLFATSGIAFVASVTLTTAANALVIVAASPLFAAVFSRLFLGERTPMRTWAAAVASLFAMLILFSGSLGGGDLAGDLLALVTAVFMAINFVVIREHRNVSMVPAAVLGGLICALVVLPLAAPASINSGNILPLLIMGTVVLPIPLVIMTVAPKLIPAPEVGLILLLETVLGPLWVWLAVGQEPVFTTFIGGSLLLVTLVLHHALAFREIRQKKNNIQQVNNG